MSVTDKKINEHYDRKKHGESSAGENMVEVSLPNAQLGLNRLALIFDITLLSERSCIMLSQHRISGRVGDTYIKSINFIVMRFWLECYHVCSGWDTKIIYVSEHVKARLDDKRCSHVLYFRLKPSLR
jgi:hypothetical protein